MAHRLFNALRTARPGMGLLLAGAGTVTAGVYLGKSESKRTSPAERYVWNTHTTSWKFYSDKAVQLARERKLEDAEESLSIALSEAIKGCGSDHPHTEEARQNLADHYGKMHKYDLAVPLYIEVVDSLTSMYGPQDDRTGTALRTLAGLYMAQKDVRATSKTMLRVIGARFSCYSDDWRLECWPIKAWPALAKSVRGLAAIYRESGHSIEDVAELLEKDLRFLTKQGEGLPPVVAHLIGMSGGAMRGRQLIEHVMEFEAEEQQEHIKELSDAEAICRALIINLKKHWGVGDGLSNLYATLARIVRAQGRLDEARQLCVEANNLYLGFFGTYFSKSNLKMPALELLREIELEDGSRDSLLRALDYRQGCCTSKQAELDEILDTIERGPPSVGPLVWDRRLDVGRPWTFIPSLWMLKEYKLKTYKRDVASNILELTEAQQRLAEVQSRLDDNLGAWAALTHALALLHSPVLAQALEWEEARSCYTAKRLRETAGKRKQEIQHQMSALHKAICSPFVDCNNS